MSEIPFEKIQLNTRGALILVDVDGTITVDGEYEVTVAARELLERWQKDSQVVLCTNTRNPERRARLAEVFEMSVTSGEHKKPSKKIVAEFAPPVPSEIIVIGDKWLIDGWFARRIDAHFIKSRRKVSGRERWFIRINYWLDDFIFHIYLWFKKVL